MRKGERAIIIRGDLAGRLPGRKGKGDRGVRPGATEFFAVLERLGAVSRGLQPTGCANEVLRRRATTELECRFVDRSGVAPGGGNRLGSGPWAEAHGYRRGL